MSASVIRIPGRMKIANASKINSLLLILNEVAQRATVKNYVKYKMLTIHY